MEHDLITWGIIIVIVALQFKIAREALNKIKKFQNIIPDSHNLKTVKTSINENQIETINHITIFNNLEKFENVESTIEDEILREDVIIKYQKVKNIEES